jgi:hypothetical protein
MPSASIAVHRLVAYVDRSSAWATMAVDLILFALTYAATAISLLRAFWVSAAVVLVGAAVSTVWHSGAALIFIVATIASLISAAVALSAAQKSEAVRPASDASTTDK